MAHYFITQDYASQLSTFSPPANGSSFITSKTLLQFRWSMFWIQLGLWLYVTWQRSRIAISSKFVNCLTNQALIDASPNQSWYRRRIKFFRILISIPSFSACENNDDCLNYIMMYIGNSNNAAERNPEITTKACNWKALRMNDSMMKRFFSHHGLESSEQNRSTSGVIQNGCFSDAPGSYYMMFSRAATRAAIERLKLKGFIWSEWLV